MLLTVEDETGFERRVIWWQGAGWPLPQGKFDMAYMVRAATYRGQRDVQVEWIDYRLVEESRLQIEITRAPVSIIDHRLEEQPAALLERLTTLNDIQIWCEAESIPGINCSDRYELIGTSKTLAIWTIPPGPAELLSVLDKVLPETVYLFGINPDLDQPEAFLRRLSGLIKYALKTNEGRIDLSELAAASGHRIRTIRAGINWLEAHGHIKVIESDGDVLVIQDGQKITTENARQTAQLLKALLEETAAFRNYYLRADKTVLINL
jgi:single-stranded-DNA-specific exonuclease